jgi:hypothetical protein
VATQFQDLGFAPSYEVEVDPEFPPSGDWGAPEFRFGHRSGETLAIRIRPLHAVPWIASFAIETRGRLINGLYGCPNPEHLLVVTGTDAYLIHVTEPGVVDDLPISPVLVVRRLPAADLVLIGSFTNLAAIDEFGPRWVTDRLFLDDLELVDGPPGKIYVKGLVSLIATGPDLLVIDADRGTVIEGDWDPSVAGPYGRPGWRRKGI